MLQNDISPSDSMFSLGLFLDSDCCCDLESPVHITNPDLDKLAHVTPTVHSCLCQNKYGIMFFNLSFTILLPLNGHKKVKKL